MRFAWRRLSGNGPHLAWRGEPPGFARVEAGALDLRWGPEGPALVASKGQSPFEFLGGLSGFLSRRCRGLRPCVESVPEPEDSSPVLTRILGYFWSLPRGVSPRLEWGHARALSSRAVAAVSRFPSRVSRDLWLPLEAFPRRFTKGLSHVPPWCQSILGLKVEAVQGKQDFLEWTETSGGLWEWWHEPGVPLVFPVESASS